ncbi:MAG: right-handed parallel beta-helix repeat-containing protein [Variovorax sp.]|nr:MAG: right-handed parallel beta-helix repeat-containing protein [Variovorax sp.]
MGADLSRVRLNPLLDYAGVELKQGGVLLDADANELVAILDRRLRALASDTLGRATVSSTTPEAFKLTLVAGALQIARGRLYVDGLLAENHGAASTQPAQRTFDELLSEGVFTQPIGYAAQPYLPNPPALPTAGVHLVYLDVWDREVTHLEEPGLVESAVGVETSSRRQTVWQVRVLGNEAGSASCASPDADIPGWSALIAPSSGRLTTGTFDVAAVADPCELPPSGGYRGLENQLYRVQIHDAGQPGTATFKWSRENGSVGSRVASMVSATQLELETLGRDEVLGIHSGDWVEITDELSQAPGEMRRVTVDAATRRITFAPALPAAMLPASFPNSDFPSTRRLRVRRWDQKGLVFRTSSGGTPVQVQDLDASGSTGLITVPAAGTTLLLENGVTVRFDATGAPGFRSGDHWEFAARTSDASVELLDRAPPRGIHHHYARLGFWDVGAGTVSDCRHPWPPAAGGGDCACTACVTPESHASGQLTIQAAIDRVRDTGGTVCLHAGQYALAEAVRITSARSLRVRGQGPATVITAAGSAFVVERSAAIALENMGLVSLGRQSAVSVRSVTGLALRELVIAVLGSNDARGAAIALTGVAAGVSICDNLIIAPDGIRAGEPADDKAPAFLITAVLRIAGNVLSCQRTGVMLAGRVAHLYDARICGNQLLGCRTQGIGVLGLALPGATMRITDNSLSVNGAGIRCAVDGVWIEANKLSAVRQGDRQPTGAGISLMVGLDPSGSDQCQVLANQIDGFPDAGVLVQAPAMELVIEQNVIERCGNGILMIDTARSGSLSIANNHLRAIGSDRADSAIGPVVAGIGVSRTDAATIAGNTVRQVGVNAQQGKQLIAGILAMSVQRSRISGNEVTEVGPQTEFGGQAAGIMLRSPYAQTALAHNHVERDAQPSEQPSPSAWLAVLIDEPDARERVLSQVAGFTAVRLDTARTLVLAGNRAWVDLGATAVDAAGAAVVRGASASLVGNTLIARGRLPAVDVSAGGDLMFCDNRCELRANTNIEAVRLASPVAVVNGNRVRGGKPSMTVSPQNAVVAAVGNITSNSIAAPLKPEMVPLNLIG